jgi:hypothetical protein
VTHADTLPAAASTWHAAAAKPGHPAGDVRTGPVRGRFGTDGPLDPAGRLR